MRCFRVLHVEETIEEQERDAENNNHIEVRQGEEGKR